MRKKTVILSLVLLGIALFSLSLFNDFVWDDIEQIVKNTSVHSLSNIEDFFRGGTYYSGGQSKFLGIYYKPLMTLIFSLIYTLFGPDPLFFHLLQISLHICNAILIYFVIKKLFRLSGQGDKISSIVSYLVSVIFLIHPINVETVVYISALQDVLFLCFGLLSLLSIIYHKEVSKLKYIHKFNINTSFITALLMLLSILSKESGIIFFWINLVYVLTFNRKYLYNMITSLVTTSIVYAVLRFIIADVPLSHEGISPIMQASFIERLITIPRITLFYLKTFFFPIDIAISWQWVVKEINLKDFFIPVTILSIISISLYYFFKKIKEDKLFKLLIFFLLWFLGSMSLHIQIFPLDMTVADRWFYLPSISLLSIIFIIILGTTKSRNDFPNKRFITFLIIILILFFYRSLKRTIDWVDGYTLYSKDSTVNKSSYDIENNLGVELIINNELREAETHLKKSIELSPDWWTNWNNLGLYYEIQNDIEQAQECYKISMSHGAFYLVYENYARVLKNEGKFDELKIFLKDEALILFPQNKTLLDLYEISLEEE